MVSELRPDLLVVGGGSAGLSVASGAAQLGAATVLVEAGAMGGDCLNVGCVPSKSLLAAAHAAHAAADGVPFGVAPAGAPVIDAPAVRRHVRGVIAQIEPHDSQERFEGLGVKVLRTKARFVDARTMEADGVRIRPRRFVIATGSRPVAPPIPGLEDTGYLTNETIWDLESMPEHLVVIGGGPIGTELAQAHRRLGSRVTVLEARRILSSDDTDAVAVVRTALVRDGIDLREEVRIERVSGGGNGVQLEITGAGGAEVIEGSHILVAAGRVANVDELELDKAGIEATPRGIVVDRGLRTTNRRAYAAGDVAGGLQFTHLAGHHASVVIRSALFRLPAKVSEVVPRVTYTDPEIASVGAAPEEAAQAPGVELVRVAFADNDRARAERRTEGHLKLAADKKGRVKGVSIVGAHAGELLQPWVMMMTTGTRLKAMASLIAPYPTLGEINKQAASAFFAPKLFSPPVRRVLRVLRLLG